MPQKVLQEDGSEIEVYTADEIEAQKQAAVELYKTSNPDKSEELNVLQEELKKANEALKGFSGKEYNFGELRKQKEAADKKIEEILKGVDEKVGAVKKEVLEGVMQDHYSETLKNLTGGDEEVKKKIEYHYKRLGDPASTKEQVTNKLRDAYLLATKPVESDALNSMVISSGGIGRLNIKSNQKFTEEDKQWAGKFGLSQEDIKKYGGQ